MSLPHSPRRLPLFLLVAAVASGPALGQADDDPPPPVDPETTLRLDPVVVTARKWEEAAEEVPKSLTVITETFARDAGIRTVRDASFYVPNLFMVEFSSRRLSFPTMRGVGSGQGDPAVTTYIDGVPQLTTGSTNIPLLDVERVEFLRGPEGTLYGRNSIGGLIHVHTKRPSNTPTLTARSTFGNYAHQEYQLGYSGPIIEDQLYLSLSGLYSVRDGYTDNVVTGHDVDDRNGLFGRGQLLWTPGDRSEVRLNLYGERARDGGFVLSSVDGLRDRPHRIAQDFEGKADRNIRSSSLTWDYEGDWFTLSTISAYQDWDVVETSDFDFSPIDGIRRRSEEDQDYFSQEVRLASPVDAPLEIADGVTLQWLAGVSGFTADSSRSFANDFRPGGAGILFPPFAVGVDSARGDFDDDAIAAFGQATVAFDERLELSAGLRYDYESKDASLRNQFETGGFVVSSSEEDLDESYDEWVPNFSASYRFDHVMVYGLAAKGFKAGGFNLRAPTDEIEFSPETSWTYEAGVKTTWFDDRLQANAAFFYIDWDDMQLSLFDAVAGGYVDNAGEATSIGFEVEVRAKPVEWLELFGGFGYTDAEFDEFIDPFGQDVSDNDLAFVPETTWNIGAQLNHETPSGYNLFARAEYVGVGDFYYDAGNREKDRFALANFRFGVDAGRMRVEAWVRNAFEDEYVPIAIQPNPADPTFFVGESGAPRTFGVTFSMTF
jgi:iron complex outermembrane receptor protein